MRNMFLLNLTLEPPLDSRFVAFPARWVSLSPYCGQRAAHNGDSVRPRWASQSLRFHFHYSRLPRASNLFPDSHLFASLGMSSLWFQPPFPFHGMYPPLSPLVIPPFSQNLRSSADTILPQLKQLVTQGNILPTASTSSFPHLKENVKNDLKENGNENNTLNKWQMFLVESLLTASASSTNNSEPERTISTESCTKRPITVSPFPVSCYLI